MGVVTKNTIGKDRSFRKFDVKVSKIPITKKSLGKIILVVYLLPQFGIVQATNPSCLLYFP